MSATLRVDDFLNSILFPAALPPVVRVEARQFPVTTHFSKRTELRNYLKETFKKVCQIHRKLPEGGVLVFLTGKREILYMCSKLHRKLNSRSSSSHALRIEQMEDEGGSIDEAVGEATVSKQMLSSTLDELMEAQEEEEGLWTRTQHESTSSSSSNDNNNSNEVFGQDGIDSDSDSDGESDSDEDDEQSVASVDRPVENQLQPLPALTTLITGSSTRDMMLKEAIGGFAEVVGDTAVVDASIAGEAGAMELAKEGNNKLEGHHAEDVAPPALRAWILPLYALMPSQLQNRVFQVPPEGHRLIVVATNVAETSITIPGIRYVVDCGRQKMKVMSSPSSSPPGDPSDRHASSAPTGAGAGIAKYEVTWISQASADQRQGRAGRTAPGHCYRLFSSNYFHQHMQPFRPPEISATPLEELVLQVGCMDVWVDGCDGADRMS
jgi:ATP-dependent RNA helicase DHX37/DHR1